jgi:CARDB
MSGKRLQLAGGVLLAAVCMSAAVAVGAPPRTQLGTFICQTALRPGARTVSVTAVMRPLTGTSGMSVMFDLLRERKRGGSFTAVRGHDLGKWIHPDNPTLGQLPGDIWDVTQKVTNLVAPALYRFRVHFRWSGAKGRRLRDVAELGPVCYQPELRADLTVRSLVVRPVKGSPPQDRYVAMIGNRGATGAGPFDVELVEQGVAPQSLSVSWLGAHATARETFAGPPCAPGSVVTVTVDPTGAVDDYARANNTLVTTCPMPTGT